MLLLIVAAVVASGAPDDQRTRYQDGQGWADSGRATEVCLREVESAAPQLMQAPVPADRQETLVLAQTSAAWAQALVRHRDHWLAARARLETSSPRPDDLIELERARREAAAASERAETFLRHFPSCRFGDPID